MPDRTLEVAIAVLCAAAVVVGCSGASNSGGDTSCADFLAMRDDDQDATVAKLLKERDGRNSSSSDVVTKRLSLVASCGPEDKKAVDIGDLA